VTCHLGIARHWERLVPAAAGVLLALPVLLVRFPPMTDLPFHEGVVALMARWGDASFVPPGVYELNLGHANQLFYALAYPVALLAGPQAACTWVIAAALVATLVAAGLLAEHVGATPWAALLVAPAALGWTFLSGFAPNVLGFAVFLAIVPVLDRFAQVPGPRRLLGACLAMALAHFAHEATLLCACLALVVLSAGQPVDRRLVVRAAPVAFAALLAYLEARSEGPLLTAFGRAWAARGVQYHPVGTKLAHVGGLLFGIETPLAMGVPAALVTACLVLAHLERRASAPRPTPGPIADAWGRRRFELLAGALLVAYAAMPFAINFGAWLYVRFLAPAFAVGVLSLSRGARSPSLLRRLLCAGTAVAWGLLVLPEFGRAEAENASVDALLARIEEPAAVAVLPIGPVDATRAYDPGSAGHRVLAERGGRVLHALTEYPTSPVLVRSSCRWDDEVTRMVVGPPTSFRPAFDLTRFSYALVRVADESRGALVDAAFRPEAERVAREGTWRLFRSNLPAVPLDAPDALPPSPPPSTLQDRARQIARPR
jgi:hypothetical protein